MTNEQTTEEEPKKATEDAMLVQRLQAWKDNGSKWQERRHPQWTENYELYRDKVITNRLTQRQSVNIPLIKETVRTLLSKFKSKLDLNFEERSGDKQKEIFKNEYWKHFVKTARLKAKDIVNKKQVMLYGRTFWKLMVADGKVNAEVIDPQDVVIERNTDPADIDGTTMDLVHRHIYRTLRELQANKGYDQAAVSRRAAFYSTEQGIKKAGENAQSAADKAQRMSDMGVPDVMDPQVGETIVELNEHYVRIWNETNKRYEFNLVTMVDDEILRGPTPLDQILGKTKDDYWLTHLPFISWADDVERTDMWSDAVADIIRTINKVLNAWFSQLVENRTLRNLGMWAYDSTAKEGWAPQSFTPAAFGFYPFPGDPNKVMKRMDVDPLDDTMAAIEFLISLSEKATAATAAEKGSTDRNQITLGEVQLALNQADERINDMQEPYEESWLEFGEKWAVLTESAAAQLTAVKLYKKAHTGKIWPQEVAPSDWLSEEGYACEVVTQADKERDALNGIQKLLATKAQFPGNEPLDDLVKQKMLDLNDISPEQAKVVMDFEKVLRERNATMMMSGAIPGAPPGSPPRPSAPPAINPQPNAVPSVAR